ncbi:MAG TPA: hypothetical protein VIJ62_08100 [Rhizomicrobium sp.]
MTTNTVEHVTFEGLVPVKSETPTLPADYDGFTWTNIGALDKAEYRGDPDGYESVIHGRDGGYTYNGQTASFSSTTHFALKSGYFASAWNTGLSVTFDGYRNGHLVAQKVVVMDQTSEKITFDSTFANLDNVTIAADTGVSSNQIAIDNLVVAFHGAIPSTPTLHEALAALGSHNSFGPHGFAGHDFSIAHTVHDWIAL